MKTMLFPALGLVLLLNTAAVTADTDAYSLRGSTEQQVESRYGRPDNVEGPVGDPPITRWIYPDFTVVFEYDRVIHAFARQLEVENLPAGSLPPRPESGDTLNLPD